MSTRKTIVIIFMIFLSSLIFIGCDHTNLTGEVVVENKAIHVGDEVPLALEVPEELSEIHRVFWDVQPDDMGTILFDDELVETLDAEKIEKLFGDCNINPDRVAVFYPKKVGKVRVYLDGFFRQTNPQPIVEIEIEVIQ
ncbi:hypothetical protein SH2C18_46910 [Clostridium sediminicola]|uniref:hypothetical protein n=1 Tax=Clostridium sediminicola TaxID=3114879 RepID=UPI0031F1EE3D